MTNKMKQLSGSTCTVNLMEICEELNEEFNKLRNETDHINKFTKSTFFGVEDVDQGPDLSADQILDRLIELKEELDNLADSCVEFKSYKSEIISAPMMPLGYCINCGRHEDLHND